MKQLLAEIRACQICKPYLVDGVRPVMNADKLSKVAIIGQAPGKKVHESGVPWQDPSGDRLRSWLQVDEDTFYDPVNFAILPMGFCYPGKGKSGDLAPRPECAPTWHAKVLAQMTQLQLTILIGQYAQKYYLGARAKANLTNNVRQQAEFGQQYVLLPHPSPRNRFWISKNPWFETEVLPDIRTRIKAALSSP